MDVLPFFLRNCVQKGDFFAGLRLQTVEAQAWHSLNHLFKYAGLHPNKSLPSFHVFSQCNCDLLKKNLC